MNTKAVNVIDTDFFEFSRSILQIYQFYLSSCTRYVSFITSSIINICINIVHC
jgi:hypothetical protein